eukprot:TRINITY_DN406_c0_g2_i3.p1 TRINITY_DN406_c0_g2~~TRINITY_DN406_c0_g2_i3.p1  ORF type:complete len:178 (-),score=42.86 TRINITY_DN406_c0_g2_i3:24-557(-)
MCIRDRWYQRRVHGIENKMGCGAPHEKLSKKDCLEQHIKKINPHDMEANASKFMSKLLEAVMSGKLKQSDMAEGNFAVCLTCMEFTVGKGIVSHCLSSDHFAYTFGKDKIVGCANCGHEFSERELPGQLSKAGSIGLSQFQAFSKLPFHLYPYLSFCLLYTSPSPRDATLSRMPSSA